MRYQVSSKGRVICAWVFAFAILQTAFHARCAEVYYVNPVLPGDHPDPSIIRVGKDYWATATSSEWGPQFPLLHSTDLVNWEQMGSVFSHRPDWAVANFWAPEISEFKGRYYVYYVGRQKDGPLNIAVAIADNPGGPYKDAGPIISQPDGAIDPVPCSDEKGQRYLVWKEDGNSVKKPTPIWAQPFSDDGTKLTGQPTELIHNDADWEGALVEGPYILRRGDWFYLFYSGSGCCGRKCHYGVGVARSHSLLGPYEKNPSNPILAGNETWKCPGHGSIVDDGQGRYFFLYHAYSTRTSVYTGREGMLDEVKFGENDWPTINNDHGPSVKTNSPFGVKQRRNDLAFSDHFKEHELVQGWQWPQNEEPGCEVGGGKLVLTGRAGHATNELAAVLARATLTGDYSAVVEINTGRLQPGVAAGLSVFGDDSNAIGVSTSGDGALELWMREHGTNSVERMADAGSRKKLYLKVTAKNGSAYHFAKSSNGQDWQSIGEDIAGMGLPPWDRAIRIALTVEGPGEASAEFDSFRMTPTE